MVKISKFASSTTPYTAGEQPQRKFIKLNTNENPYPPAKECADAAKRFDVGQLKLYPDLAVTRLKRAIAQKEKVREENVFVGNGSDEVLAFAVRAFFDPDGEKVIFPKITYSFYPVYCNLFDVKYGFAENESDFSVDVEKLTGGQGAIIANPNAPTSLSLPLESIERLLEINRDKPVIVDEAYIDFAVNTSSAVPLIERYDNLAVIKTFSKSYSLAGIRCGYMIANERLIKAVETVRDCFNSYPVDSLCQEICVAAVKAERYHKDCVASVIKTRKRVIEELRRRGREVLDSDTNFLFVKGGQSDYLKLKENGILVRWFDAERVRDYTRVTVGSDEEMDAYLKALP